MTELHFLLLQQVSWGAAYVKLHTGLGQSQLEWGSGTELQRNFDITVPRSLDSVAYFSSWSFLQ